MREGPRSGRSHRPSRASTVWRFSGADLAEQLGQHGRFTDAVPGDPLSADLRFKSPDGQRMARISSVCSSIPRWILRQTRRLAPPCLRACHSPSPLTLTSIPVLSIARQGIAQQCPERDQQVRRPMRAAPGDDHGQSLLASARCAEVGHRPVEADRAEQALDDPGCLPDLDAKEPGAPPVQS